MLAALCTDNSLRIWGGEGDACRRMFATGNPQQAAFSRDGATLAVAGRWGTISLWDPASRRRRATFRGHPGCTLSLAFSADGSILASGGDDEAVKLWGIEGSSPKHARGAATHESSEDRPRPR